MEANVFNSRLHPININMRCIEIIVHNVASEAQPLININMRCIEIRSAKITWFNS